MMRAKRPRSIPAPGAGPTSGGRGRSMSDDNLGDDHLLHMDPSLMTERQQLAFLLRATAHDQSSSDSATQSSASSDDEVSLPAAKRPKQRMQRPKISPRNTNEADDVAAKRARPRKASPKTVEDTAAKSTPRTRPSAAKDKQLRVKTSATLDADELSTSTSLLSIVKPSPSSASDFAHVSVFQEHEDGGDLWRTQCALCSQSTSPLGGVAPEPLFLCAACDAKYPTQRALGLV